MEGRKQEAGQTRVDQARGRRQMRAQATMRDAGQIVLWQPQREQR
jgi:hypothetical protein